MNQETEKIISSIAFENIEKHPNILIAARFWDDRRYHAARVCYKFMRMIDDYIDDRKARDNEISCLEKEELSEKVNSWMECLNNVTDHDPFYTELKETISTFKIPLQIFHNFAKSMLYDIDHNGFATLDDFIGAIGVGKNQLTTFCILHLEFMISVIERINQVDPGSTEELFFSDPGKSIGGFICSTCKNAYLCEP